MRYRIGAAILLSLLLLLSMPVLPAAVAADGGKDVIKDMVQAPADYGVGCICFQSEYYIPGLRYELGGGTSFFLQHQMLNYRFFRLVVPGPPG